MTTSELKDRIKKLAKKVYSDKTKSDDAAFAYDELTKFPELKVIIVNLLTPEFDSFLESIDWVSPRPSIFRINLLNGQNFTLEYNERSWVAKVEGKKYYLLNLDEEERAAKSVGRILQYGPQSGADVDGDDDGGADDNLDEE
tara:strand:- start:1201 stop:1626 length:426 start_codon:yes stop_codon:yes gene_type:complete